MIKGGTRQNHNYLRPLQTGDESSHVVSMTKKRLVRKSSMLMMTITMVVAMFGFTENMMRGRALEQAFDENAHASKYDGGGASSFYLPFYNLNQDDEKPGYLPLDKYPEGEGPVIAALVSSRPSDIQDLKVALKSLAFLKGDKDPEALAPVLIFNEGDLGRDTIKDIVASTDRPIGFPKVNFGSFPQGFDPVKEKIAFPVKGRDPFGYVQMIRFWTTMVWKHPAVQHFDTVMRIDSDSCFKEVNDYLPNFMYDGLYYHSQYVGVEPNTGVAYIDGIIDFVKNYMETKKQPDQARNHLLWHYTESVWANMKTLPLFRTNFELAKRSFMQRGDVSRFNEALTEKEPFGVLRKRWGDAVLRFITMAVFEDNDRVMTVRPTGYYHKHGCSAEEVELALKKSFPQTTSNA